MESKQFTEEICKFLSSKKAEDILMIDVREKTVLCDYFIIASGRNTTQVRALCDNVEEQLSQKGIEPRRTEGVRDALEATGLFSDVRLAEKPEPDTYHIAFTFHTGGTDGPTSGSAWNWALKSLTLIPVWDNATFDGAAVVYLRGKPIHAAGAAECLQKFIWLPLAPLGLLWSDPVAWHFTEKGVINNLVNDVSAYHRQRFLPPPKRTTR